MLTCRWIGVSSCGMAMVTWFVSWTPDALSAGFRRRGTILGATWRCRAHKLRRCLLLCWMSTFRPGALSITMSWLHRQEWWGVYEWFGVGSQAHWSVSYARLSDILKSEWPTQCTPWRNCPYSAVHPVRSLDSADLQRPGSLEKVSCLLVMIVVRDLPCVLTSVQS